MADYPFKINITTKDNIKFSFYTGSLATNADTVVSASVMVDRINNMKSGSNFVESIEAPTSLATHGSTFYGATDSGNNGIHWLSASFDHPNTGSITFTDTETAASGGLDFYTFYGTKVCSVLGLPEGVPVYTENFKLSDSSTDTTNYVSGEFISDRVALKKGFKMSPQARVQSNLVWDHAFGEGFIQWVSGSTSKMSMGYDNVNDQYKLSAPTASVNRVEASSLVSTNKIDLSSGANFTLIGPDNSVNNLYIGDGEFIEGSQTISQGDGTSEIYLGSHIKLELGIYNVPGARLPSSADVTSANDTANKMTMTGTRTKFEIIDTGVTGATGEGGITVETEHDTTWASSNTTAAYQLLLQNHTETQNAFAGIAFQVGDDDTGGLNDLDAINGAIAVLRDNTTNNLMDGNMIFATNDDADGDLTERMRIHHDGGVKIHLGLGVGTDGPTTAGLIRATNDVVAYYSSDKRLKDNLIKIGNPLDKISQLNGYEFDWIAKEGIHENEGHDVGVIAQEVEKVLPEVVQTRESGYKAVKYEKIVPLLIESIKELKQRVEELENGSN